MAPGGVAVASDIEYMKTTQQQFRAKWSKQGQALVELIVSLVAIVVLFAAIIQVARFAIVEHETSTEARRVAGQRALSPIIQQTAPDFIDAWYEGPDARQHSRDDLFTDGDAAGFRQTVVESGAAAPSEWSYLDQGRSHPLRQLRNAPDPANAMGMVYARESDWVELLPGVRHLLYRADTIEIESEVWLSSTKNLY